MASVQSVACPSCGSVDLMVIAWNRRKCLHCGTEALLSDDRKRLELVGWECSDCGFNNEAKTTYCGKCGTPLVKICPKCLVEMRLDLEFCNSCGTNHESYRRSLLETTKGMLDAGRIPKRGARYLGAVLELNPDDQEALVLRGQMYLIEASWRQAVADWGQVYRRDPGFSPARRQLRLFVDQNIHVLLERGYVEGRLRDDKSRHYLEAIRARLPSPPPPPGKTTMGLLHRYWPTKAQLIQEMYEAKLSGFEVRSDEIMGAQTEAREDLLTLALMCVEGLEEKAERQRQAQERARQMQAKRERNRRQREARRQARRAEKRVRNQGVAARVVEPRNRPRRRCCCFPLAICLALVPGIITGLLLWIR